MAVKEMKTAWCQCGQCGRGTNHDVLHEERLSIDNGGGFECYEIHQFLRCRGCLSFSYRTYLNDPRCDDSEYGEDMHNEVLHPPQFALRKTIDTDNCEVPEDLKKLYFESSKALDNSMPLAAAILIRALVEAICKHQGIITGNLEKKIDKLGEEGILAKRQAEILHKLRELGNYAAHEFIEPSSRDVVTAFEIAEIIMKTIYELPQKSEDIKMAKRKSLRPSLPPTTAS